MLKKPFFRFFLSVVIIALTLYVFYTLRMIMLPFLVGYILHYALKPIVNLLNQRGFKHRTAVITVFSLFFFLVALFLRLFVPAVITELSDIQDNIPVYSKALTEKLSILEETVFGELSTLFASFNTQGYDIREIVTEYFSESFLSMLKKAPSFIISILPLFLYILIIPFATFFFLLDEYRLKKILIGYVPNRYFEVTLNLFYNLNRQFGWLLRGMLISAILMSVIISLLLWTIDLDYHILVGVFSGVANLIPYAGPVVGCIAAFIVAIMTDSPNIMFLYIILVFLIANSIDNIFIQPLIMARAANLHPLAVILLVLVGSHFGGILGMLVAVPLTSLLQVTLRILYRELARPVRPDFSEYRDIDANTECLQTDSAPM